MFPSFPRYKEGTGGRGQVEPGPPVVKGRELALKGLILHLLQHLLSTNASNAILFVLKNMTYYKMTMTVESV